jgi:N-acetylneuraminic acid mutarotase
MVDSRAKNLFLTTWDGNIWYPTFYDLDTAFGLNNEGENVNNYDVEYHDIIGTKNAFNGESSVLWNNFEQVYADEIQEFYNNLRNNKLVTYDTVMNILYEQQVSKICESNYNYDAIEKYKNPLVEDGDGTYMYCAQGNRLDHLKWWLYNRLNYIDSKYVSSDNEDDCISLRIYTPTVYGGVIPNADAHITPYADQYVNVDYDKNMLKKRGYRGQETTITAPNQIFNDTPMTIFGASRISDIGDLSPLYAGTINVSKGIKLKQLIIGSKASGYSNTNLKVLAIGNNKLLTKLDVSNCPSLTQAIDVSGCTNIKEVYAKGTSTTAVKVPNGGNLKVLHLPNTITNLTILNQPFITDFQCENFSKITTLRLENTPLDSLLIVQQAINSLERVRLTNVNWTLNNSTLLDKFMTLKGLNEKGENTEKAVLTGKIHISGTIPRYYIDDCIDYFGTNITITADTVELYYKCSFYNYDGTLLDVIILEDGEKAVYIEDTPTHEYDYQFLGWSRTPNADKPDSDLTVTSKTNLYAIYDIPYLTTVVLGLVLPTARTETSAVAIKKNVYIIGGYGDGFISEIVKLDTKNGIVTTLNSGLPSERANASAIAIGTNIYIFGGVGSSKLNEIIKIDTKTETVTILNATLPSARQNTSAVVIGNNAYIFGGKGQTLLNEIIKFDTSNETVTKLHTTLPYNANNTSSVVMNDNAYIFGGNAMLNSIVEFDSSSETATTLPTKLPYNVNNSSSVAIGNNAYIFGGDATLDSIVEYDNTSKTITTINNVLPTARTGTSAVAIENDAYVFGGYSNAETNEIIRVIKN